MEKLVTRAYNRFEVDETRGVVRKLSSTERLRDEILYYVKLQKYHPSQAVFFPRLLDHVEPLIADFWMDLELYSYPNVGNYLFGDKDSGVKIGWYKDEMEVDTTAEKLLFNFLKRYADSEANVYSTVSLDPYLETFRKLKKEYPEIADSKLSSSTYIYRGTVISEERAAELYESPNKEETQNNIIIPNQTFIGYN
jgi:hypothetical protein